MRSLEEQRRRRRSNRWLLLSAKTTIVLFVLLFVVRAVQGQQQQQKPKTATTTTKQRKQNPAAPWSYQTFPNPDVQPDVCGTKTSYRLCDPDGLLLLNNNNNHDNNRNTVEASLMQPLKIRIPPSAFCQQQQTANDDQYDVQIGVALVRKMKWDETRIYSASQAAEVFARTVHNQWGVGQIICSNSGSSTGVLIFVSQLDRALFVSKGSALDSVLTDRRLDRIIEYTMKPFLRSENYAEAITAAIQDIHKYVEQGPPSVWENLQDCVPYFFVSMVVTAFAGLIYYSNKQFQEQQRVYARVKSQLSEIDRSKAQALQGKYRCKSCPICLEEFVVKAPSKPQVSPKSSDKQQQQQEAPLLAEKNETKDNQQQQEKEKEPQEESTDTTSNNNDDDLVSYMGSDGLPLKLLRCGHVFDETCWSQWVEQGTNSSRVGRCPICNASLYDDNDNSNNNNNNNLFPPLPRQRRPSPQQRPPSVSSSTFFQRTTGFSPPPPPPVQPSSDSYNDHYNSDSCNARWHQEQQYQQQDIHSTAATAMGMEAVLRRYQQERLFRLHRLGARYPTFVDSHMVRRWTTSSTMNDDLLSQDTQFLQRDPIVVREQQQQQQQRNGSCSSGSRSGFGGGSSGGGRGGTW